MRSRGVLRACVCLVGFLALIAGQAGTSDSETRWMFFTPKKAKEKKIRINVCGNERSYYRLDHKAPLDFTAEGPGRVKIITRHLPSEGTAGRGTYTIRVTRGSSEKEVFLKEIPAEESSAIMCSTTGDPVGEGEASILHVPRGKWVFRIHLQDTDTAVVVRLFREQEIAKEVLVNRVPDKFERVLVLVQASGNEYPHYHFSSQHPLEFGIRGPVTLSIRTRLDFTPGGRDVAPYGVQLAGRKIVDGQVHHEFSEISHFWARRLEKARYKDCPEIVPGESMVVELDVPAGQWTIEIRPIHTDVPGLTARILVPKSALATGKNE
jgi:hypothetical protein